MIDSTGIDQKVPVNVKILSTFGTESIKIALFLNPIFIPSLGGSAAAPILGHLHCIGAARAGMPMHTASLKDA
jgi:hypothetical protein